MPPAFADGVQSFPRKISEYFLNPTEVWKGGNPYDGEISISKISPNLYSVDYLFQNPVNYPESSQLIGTLTNCLANHIAEMTQSKGWDVGYKNDMLDNNLGKPLSNMSYLVLTGVKDGETRAHATGRTDMYWAYGNILNNKNLQYENSYPSVIGECKKLLKPEYATYMAPNNFVWINGKKLPTRLWALANKDQQKQSSVDWDSMKNAMISYRTINARLLKIEFRFNDPVSNMYILSMNIFAGCIGSYMAPQKDYEAFALGWPQLMQSDPPGSDTSSRFVFYTLGLNGDDDLKKLGNGESIKWLASPDRDGMSRIKIVSKNMAEVCPKLVNSIYLDEGRR